MGGRRRWWRRKISSQRTGNVPHVARVWLSGNGYQKEVCTNSTNFRQSPSRTLRATCGFYFLKISILTSEPKSGIHREPDVALFSFKVGDSRFSLLDCQQPRARGSLTMCRSETGMTQSGMAIPDMKIPHVAGFSWGCHVRHVRYVLCQCSSIE